MPSRLEAYQGKRDFSVSPEPTGGGDPTGGRRFVVQKHAARRLHYDFRLEWDGVLLSWAVTRGPSADPTAKRLAVRTEDHPIDYGAFEGVIPEAQYGAGAVMLWDQGTWAPLGDVTEGLTGGLLKFALMGARMRGAWMLVRMRARAGERGENWLLIKDRDAEALEGAEALIEAHRDSVATGRSIEEIAAGKAAAPPTAGAAREKPAAGKPRPRLPARRRQEFVIGGWSPSAARGRPFASLLIGTFERGVLRYRGRVGSGFGAPEFAALASRLETLAAEASPFDAVPPDAGGARWVRPVLAAEVRFAGVTGEGAIRRGVFLGLKEDEAVTKIGTEGAAAAHGGAEQNGGPRVRGQRISSPGRRVFETPVVTKLEVAEHYAAFAERILPFAGRRPVSLLRCPDGVEATCFFQKHRGPGMPAAIGAVTIRESKGGEAEYITVSNAAGLVGAAQMGAIEFHIWGARSDRLEAPDRMVFDLDPDAGLGFAKVRAAALDLGARLDALGLPSIPMLTGGKGVHVIVPLRPKADWETVTLFARGFATRLAEEAPKRYTATMAKKERTGRIFIDWLRNERGATAVAPYSLRARPGAKAAVPLSWAELRAARSAGAFDIRSVRARLDAPCPLRAATRRAVTLGPAVGRLSRAPSGEDANDP